MFQDKMIKLLKVTKENKGGAVLLYTPFRRKNRLHISDLIYTDTLIQDVQKGDLYPNNLILEWTGYYFCQISGHNTEIDSYRIFGLVFRFLKPDFKYPIISKNEEISDRSVHLQN